MDPIPFNRPRLVGGEHAYIDEALSSGQLSGNGRFARECGSLLTKRLSAQQTLIVPSCTAALEMCALLLDLQPGDEVVMPSFTFVSTANAFALRGAVPVFADLDPETLNLDAGRVAAAMTPRTKAIVVVHYGGVACDMDAICAVAARHGVPVIEDAAHSLPASYNGRPLGSIGALSTFSFHETKNVQCGEGGALVVNDPSLVEQSEILQEKGTDRSRFFRGQVDKYTWQSIGSSYLLSEVASAFLLAQLEQLDRITQSRLAIWTRYHEAFAEIEADGLVRRPVVPAGREHSGHLYYLLVDASIRSAFIARLKERGVASVFHYVPLHESPAGRLLGRADGDLSVTVDVSGRLLRLPLWSGLSDDEVEHVIGSVQEVAREVVGARA